MLLRRALCRAVPRRAVAGSHTTKLEWGRSAIRPLSTTSPKAEEETAPKVEEAAKAPKKKKQEFSFQAETANLLNIVSNALYTEKEIFVRELLSNASDALEKCRQRQVSGEAIADEGHPLEIHITVDSEKKRIVFEDGGLGMSHDELATNLGTIALSGSKKYAESLEGSEDASKIIGQFGVGFYSAFMVASKVVVESKSALGGGVTRWASEDGAASYTLEEVKGEDASEIKRGSRITVDLKEGCYEYADVAKLKGIIKQYSNFVSFPITVDGARVNKVEAIWARDPKEVEQKEYEEFYRHTFKDAYDKPSFVQHFRADAPLEIKALVCFPSFHTEKMGQGRLSPSMQLYSRKVMIESPCHELAPDWMRFAKGVVDSEDIPLSISREKSQDRRLLAKLQDIVVRKTLRFLADQAKTNRKKYLEWFDEFDVFLKEGCCHDPTRTADLAKLLYFDSSKCQRNLNEKTSFDEYLGRLKPDDDELIYYLYAPSRELAEASPYFEAFKREDRECLFVYNAIDDFVMSNVGTFNGRKIQSAETAELKPAKKEGDKADAKDAAKKDDGDVDEKKDEAAEAKDAEEKGAAEDQADEEAKMLSAWLCKTLGDRVDSCKPTTRLTDSPAVVTDAESGAMRRMMAMVSQQANGEPLPPLGKQKLLINPSHPVIRKLHALSVRAAADEETRDLAQVAANQLLDNALVAAGLIDDPRSMLPRLAKLLEISLSTTQLKLPP